MPTGDPPDYACRWDAPSCRARVDEQVMLLRLQLSTTEDACGMLESEVKQLRAEVERLRAALQALRPVRVSFDNDGGGYFDESSSYCDPNHHAASYYYRDDVDAITRLSPMKEASQ